MSVLTHPLPLCWTTDWPLEFVTVSFVFVILRPVICQFDVLSLTTCTIKLADPVMSWSPSSYSYLLCGCVFKVPYLCSWVVVDVFIFILFWCGQEKKKKKDFRMPAFQDMTDTKHHSWEAVAEAVWLLVSWIQWHLCKERNTCILHQSITKLDCFLILNMMAGVEEVSCRDAISRAIEPRGYQQAYQLTAGRGGYWAPRYIQLQRNGELFQLLCALR